MRKYKLSFYDNDKKVNARDMIFDDITKLVNFIAFELSMDLEELDYLFEYRITQEDE